jgi:hypothetical protein
MILRRGIIVSIYLLAGSAAALAQPADSNANSDLAPVPASEAAYGTADPGAVAAPAAQPLELAPEAAAVPAAADTSTAPAPAPASNNATATADPNLDPVFSQSEVLSAAENAFGRGAEGLAAMIETIFKDNGRPNAYIVGREAGGAIGVGLRYGSGTLFHKVEGDMPVFWRGPSLGFDVGGDANRTFTLVYRLFDREELFKAFPAVEGKVYLVGGLTANYLQRGELVIIPIKLGVGWRLGANAGYTRFSKKGRVLPF